MKVIHDKMLQMEMINAETLKQHLEALPTKANILEMHDGFTWDDTACITVKFYDETLNRIKVIDALIES